MLKINNHTEKLQIKLRKSHDAFANPSKSLKNKTTYFWQKQEIGDCCFFDVECFGYPVTLVPP